MAKAAKKTEEAETPNTKKVIAVHEIVRCIRPGQNGDPKNGVAAVKPRTQTLPATTVFLANTEEDEDGNSEYQSLLDAGAIRDYTKKDEAELRRMSNVVGNIEDEEAVAAASSTEGSSGSVKTSANAGTTTAGSRATGGEGTNLI